MPSRSAALSNLETTTTELASSHRELAQLLAAEKEGKIRSWVASEDTSVTSRDRWADHMVMDLTLDIIKLKGEIAALEATKTYLMVAIEYGY